MGTGSRILIKRKKGVYRDFLRAYKVLVDGEVQARLRRGGTVEVEVKPGRHVVEMKVDWCSSPEVTLDLEPGQTARLYCSPNTPDLDNVTWTDDAERPAALASYSIGAVIAGKNDYIALRPVPDDVHLAELD